MADEMIWVFERRFAGRKAVCDFSFRDILAIDKFLCYPTGTAIYCLSGAASPTCDVAAFWAGQVEGPIIIQTLALAIGALVACP